MKDKKLKFIELQRYLERGSIFYHKIPGLVGISPTKDHAFYVLGSSLSYGNGSTQVIVDITEWRLGTKQSSLLWKNNYYSGSQFLNLDNRNEIEMRGPIRSHTSHHISFLPPETYCQIKDSNIRQLVDEHQEKINQQYILISA